jgi:alkylation response protein AidB-like acyl-CoA dehydrogenase
VDFSFSDEQRALLAAARSTAADARDRRRALAATKVVINRAGRFIAQEAVQLHGAMGMTDELQVSHWFKRLVVIEMTLGDTDTQLCRFSARGSTSSCPKQAGGGPCRPALALLAQP